MIKETSAIQIEDFQSTERLEKALTHAPDGLFVTKEGVAQFVVLTVENFERLHKQYQRLKLREQYIRSLADANYSSSELQALLVQLDASDKAWLSDSDVARENLISESRASFDQFAAERGIDVENVDEQTACEVIDDLVDRARRELDAPESGR